MKTRIIFQTVFLFILSSGIAWAQNIAPVCDYGGPYSVAEGAMVQLDGSASYDPNPGDVLTFDWSLNGDDGVYETPGISVWFDASGRDGPTNQIVCLRVTDNYGASCTACTSVDINNAAPVAECNGPYTAFRDVPIQVTANGSYDPSPLDILVFSWDLDNNGSFETLGMTAPYTGSGIVGMDYTIVMRAQDDDGGSSQCSTTVRIVNEGVVDQGGGGHFTTIQDCIDATSNGDTCLVKDGTYTGAGNKSLDFGGKAITLQSENGRETTIIDCEYSGRGFIFQSGEGSDSIVDGFTIQNGLVTTGVGGVGMLITNSSPTINNCRITQNEHTSASASGGAVYLHSSSALMENCEILSNNSHSRGGGIHSDGSSFLTIHNSEITGNVADTYGGGISLDGASLTITNSIIDGNNALYHAAGVYCSNSATLFMTNCVVFGNENINSNAGGGIWNSGSSSTITNSIFWDNSPDQIWFSGGSLSVAYSDIQGGWAGTGNINSDPLFVDSASGDFHLQMIPVASPCINIGDNSAPNLPSDDFEGDSRIINTVVDLGADEANYPTLIELEYLDATGQDGAVLIQWGTASEIDNEGFNILRSTEEYGVYVRINDTLIPAEGGPLSGADYEYTDNDVENDTTYWYKLEDVDVTGLGTLHGPVSATPSVQGWVAAEVEASTLGNGSKDGSGLANSILVFAPVAAFLFVWRGVQRRRRGQTE